MQRRSHWTPTRPGRSSLRIPLGSPAFEAVPIPQRIAARLQSASSQCRSRKTKCLNSCLRRKKPRPKILARYGAPFHPRRRNPPEVGSRKMCAAVERRRRTSCLSKRRARGQRHVRGRPDFHWCRPIGSMRATMSEE